MSARSCMMSGRLPFGRFLYVGGKSETRLNQIVPGEPVEITKRFFVDGMSFPVFKVAVYFFHSDVTGATSAIAKTIVPSLLSMATVSGPFRSLLVLSLIDSRM